MSAIYVEMYVADQWLKDHPASAKTADTTLFYDPIFKKYGYNFRDYDASLRHYVSRPEDYLKIIEKSVKMLEADLDRLEDIKTRQERARKLNAAICGYEYRDFADLATSLYKYYAERRDSVRTDSLKAPWVVAGIEPIADKREDLQL